MSSIDQISNNGSLPSSDNDSDMDYGDRDGYDVINPVDINLDKVEAKASPVSVEPSKIRMYRLVERIIPDATREYTEFISNMYYQWKTFGKKIPEKHSSIIKYVDSRI